MASDQDYMSFLDKANEDPSKGQAQVKQQQQQQQGNTAAASKKKFRTTQEGVEVPAPLARVCGGSNDEGAGVFYVSDADEPFEAVALGWDEAGKGLPDEGLFWSPPPSSSPLFHSLVLLFHPS